MRLVIASVMIGLSVYYLSCNNNNDDRDRLNNLLFPNLGVPDQVDCGKIILADGVDSDYPVMEPYKVNNAEFNADTLTIQVSYSGGCKEHGFCLIGWNYFLESYPVQAKLLLSHNSNKDHCDAIITSELRIDMSPLKEEYFKQYGNEHASIAVRILISSGEELNLLYKF
jgi:hypothetical protein